MTARASLGEVLLGVEGLALLRLAAGDDVSARQARVDEMRALLQRIDDATEQVAVAGGPEYDLIDGYRLWSETYDCPLRLSPIEEPAMHQLFDSLAPSVVLDAACGTGRHSVYLAERGHRVIGIDGLGSSGTSQRRRTRSEPWSGDVLYYNDVRAAY